MCPTSIVHNIDNATLKQSNSFRLCNIQSHSIFIYTVHSYELNQMQRYIIFYMCKKKLKKVANMKLLIKWRGERGGEEGWKGGRVERWKGGRVEGGEVARKAMVDRKARMDSRAIRTRSLITQKRPCWGTLLLDRKAGGAGSPTGGESQLSASQLCGRWCPRAV